MICNPQSLTLPCKFINLNNTNLDKKNDDKKGLLIIYKNKLFAIKIPTFNNKPIEIVYEIPVNDIKSTNIKDKFYVHINFIIKNGAKNKEGILIANFTYEIDSEKLINSINKAKESHS